MWITLVCLTLVSALEDVSSFAGCEACKFTVKNLQGSIENPHLISSLESLIVEACSAKQDKEVCAGAIHEMGTIVVDSIATHYLDPEFACVQLKKCTSPKYRVEDLTQWQKSILADKPSSPQVKVDSTQRIQFGHITDLHFDLEYKVGSNAQCKQPLCCRDGTGDAGPWGNYNCDIPYQTMEAALTKLAELKPEFIIWTGDSPPHDVWKQSYESNGHYISEAVKLVRKMFPDIPVYPALGNHGCYPVNIYQFGNEPYLNNLLASLWEPWIGSEGAKTVKETGSYSVLHPKSNLRVIHVNTQACNNMNFHFFANVTDPGGLIEWLGAELKQAEKRGEVVYILGHIYGSSCLTTWAYHYATLVDRYEHIIRGQFYGHTHSDVIQLNRGVFSGRQTGVMFMPGSITTYTNINPSFRLVEIDPSTFVVTNYFQYRMDIIEANRLNQAEWKLVYDPLSEYGLKDLSPRSIYDFAQRILTDEALAIKYLTNRETAGPGAPKSCDASCRHQVQCEIAWGVDADVMKCSGGKPSFQDRALDALFGQWIYKESK